MVASTAPDSTVSPFVTSTLATVPSCGATTGVSIFMILGTTRQDHLSTAAPGSSATSTTLPAAPAVMEMPSPACGCCRFCCRSRCRCCCSWSRCCCRSAICIFFYGYIIYVSVYGNCITFSIFILLKNKMVCD